MKFHEGSGPSLKESRELDRRKRLDHIIIHGHAEGTPERPKWLLEHHHEGGGEPDTYEFSHGGQMLNHIIEHANIPDEHLTE